VVGCTFTLALGDTEIVNDTFDNYADQGAFQAAWRPDNGDGVEPPLGPADPTEAGLLVPDLDGITTPPNDNPPDLQGKAVNVLNGINESRADFSLVPSATQSIRFGADIFNDGPITNDSPNGMRQSVGLRNDNVDRDPATFGCQCGLNFVELGFYNTDGLDPRDGVTVIPSTQFQYRIALFGLVPDSDLIRNPDWLSFPLDPALDQAEGESPAGDYSDNGTVDAADYTVWRDKLGTSETLPNDPIGGTIGDDQYDQWKNAFGQTSADGVVDINDIGEGWHRFTATIALESVTVELDLYRDGINNATGEAGVDSSVTWAVQPNADPATPGTMAPFNSLRMGPPSGIAGNDEAVIDNIFLTMVDLPLAAAAAVPEPASLVSALGGCVASLLCCIRRR